MRTTLKIIVFIGILIPTSAFAQKVKKVVVKGDNYTETYTVLKSDRSVKHGKYSKANKHTVFAQGSYVQNKKDGKWTISTDEFYYKMGHLDSFYGNKSGKLVGIKYDERGKEVSRYFHNAFFKKSEVKEGNRTRILQIRISGFDTDTMLFGYTKNGKKEGQWKFIDNEGNYSIMNYKKDRQRGMQQSYYSNGQPYVSKHINDDGEFIGAYLVFHKNGDTLNYENYENGVLNGPSLAKFNNGNVFYRAVYKNGRLMEYEEYDSKGKLNELSSVKDGNGVLYSYRKMDDKIEVSSKYDLKNGLPDGEAQFFYKNKLKESKLYENGMFQKFIVTGKNSKVPKNPDTMFVSPSTFFIGFPVSSQAVFQEGETGLQRYLAANMTYPDLALENDVFGQVLIEFVVDEFGDVTRTKVRSSKLGYGLEEEALRVVKSTSGMWIPASQYGFPVKMRYRIPLKFQIF